MAKYINLSEEDKRKILSEAYNPFAQTQNVAPSAQTTTKTTQTPIVTPSVAPSATQQSTDIINKASNVLGLPQTPSVTPTQEQAHNYTAPKAIQKPQVVSTGNTGMDVAWTALKKKYGYDENKTPQENSSIINQIQGIFSQRNKVDPNDVSSISNAVQATNEINLLS